MPCEVRGRKVGEDARVAGFAPWHWDSRAISETSLYKEVGVVDMPKAKAAWRAIGERMLRLALH